MTVWGCASLQNAPAAQEWKDWRGVDAPDHRGLPPKRTSSTGREGGIEVVYVFPALFVFALPGLSSNRSAYIQHSAGCEARRRVLLCGWLVGGEVFQQAFCSLLNAPAAGPAAAAALKSL